MPPALKHDFVADTAFMKVVLAGGGTASIKIDGAWAAAVDAVVRVSGASGAEVFLEVSRSSSGASVVAYGFRDGRLIPAGVDLSMRAGTPQPTLDSAACPGNPLRLIQRTFLLIGPTMYGWWRETNVIYAWHGPKLVQISSRTFKRRGAVLASDTALERSCIKGVH